MGTKTSFSITDPLPQGTVLLAASAGTGKTWTISAVCAKAIATGMVKNIENLLLVTFNRSAARELRGRVYERLVSTAALLAGDRPSNDACDESLMNLGTEGLDRVRAALDSFDRAVITTTHEFASRMLVELGILSDHDPSSVLMADLTPLATEVSDDFYLARYFDVAQPPSVNDKRKLSRDVAVKYGEVPIAPHTDVVSPDLEWTQSVRAEVRKRSRARAVHTFDDLIADLLRALRDPVRGQLARETLARRFALVMVDEFQDTDPLQWEILRLAFHERSNLWLIGDPKQSIYAFRGADIYAYQDAAESAEHVLHLDVNYRADKPIVEAISTLFGNAQLGRGIAMEPVTADHQRSRIGTQTTHNHRYSWSQPFQIRCLEAPADVRMDAATSERMVTEDVVNQVIMMLEGGTVIHDDDGQDRPLRPNDIAILVRTRRRGAAIAAALSQANQPAVFSGDSPVWTSQAAKDLVTLLEALDNTDERLRTRLCLSDLIGATPADLAASDSRVRSDLAIDVARWASVWPSTGVWGTVEAALHRPGVLARLVSMTDGERYVTDLRQVAQQAHAASCDAALTPTAAAAWIRDQQQRVGDDEPRRLDSDQQAVNVMTIHEAKGLGFPVVLLPDISHGWSLSNRGPIVWHDGHRRVLSISSQGPDRDTAVESHQEDERGENLRLLYVALTRARSAVRLWWWPCSSRNQGSAFQRLVEMDRSSGELGLGREGTNPRILPWLNSGPIMTATAPANQKHLSRTPSIKYRDVASPRQLTRPLELDFVRTSYSGLTTEIHGGVLTPLAATLTDEPEEDESTDITATGLCGLPGGTSFGTVVHEVLEHIDTSSSNLSHEVLAITRRILRTAPLPDVPAPVLAAGLEQVLRTDLGDLAQGMTLASFSPDNRLAEMNFELAMCQSKTAQTMADLAALLRDPGLVPSDDPISGYGDALSHIPNSDQTLRGFLTGSIDAVLRRPDDRYLVVDYKTNRVPGARKLRAEMYDTDTMRAMMFSSHYPLQGLLYSAALHRFLVSSLPGYDPARHLGPIGYLFVRGMTGGSAPETGMPQGVFTWHPKPDLIEAISECLGGRHA
ncbi:UvrD-helicase domain-containing protein [Cutibacterium sp.]|uniref:UvrD-helicase domain-containing protein n=1 Tax=Cutibacterium sp. TaxID=1912221 RepID=UPI0026DB0FA2|nr:UvrD-helicase domain-containing protein [Cutibacterium sp.]MDO4412071.1 UvrD-helicase domain-containing protein [Cutibacterium sp.]